MVTSETTDKTIGIDLGTTHSMVAALEGAEATVIPSAEGSRTTPTLVGAAKPWTEALPRPLRRLAEGLGVSSAEKLLVGERAKRDPQRTVTSIKHRLGTEDRLTLGQWMASPEELAAWFLQKLKHDAEAYLDNEVKDAVITVPLSFSDSQREAIHEAGRLAGLDAARILDDPVATAMAYGLHKRSARERVAVFDLGGGTFQFSVLTVGQQGVEVEAADGEAPIGGEDWDHRIVNHVAEEFRKHHGIDLRQGKMPLQRLKDAAEQAKIELSQAQETRIRLPYIAVGASGTMDLRGPQPKHLDTSLTRAKLEELTGDLLEQCKAACRQALAEAHIQPGNLDRLLLVGGGAHMPQGRELAKEIFGEEPTMEINPEECVARGAAAGTETTPDGPGPPREA